MDGHYLNHRVLMRNELPVAICNGFSAPFFASWFELFD